MSHSRYSNYCWLIPCFNEEASIQVLIHRIRKIQPGAIICVCDNGSTDQTAHIAQEAGAIVIVEPLKGKGHAVRRLFSEVHAEYYFLIDGDLTYDIESCFNLMQPLIRDEADMVVGARTEMIGGALSFVHKIGNRFLTGLLNLFFRQKLQDVLSGYRAFNRRFVKNSLITAKGFELEVELTIQALVNNFRVVEIPTKYRPRQAGSYSKLRPYRDGVFILFTIVKLAKDYKPLTFFGLTSLVTGGLSICFYLFNYDLIWKILSLLSAASLFAGLILNSISQRTKKLNYLNREQNFSESFENKSRNLVS